MSKRQDREQPAIKNPLVNDAQAHKALEDLMRVVDILTDTVAWLADVRGGYIDENTVEGRSLDLIMRMFRSIDADSPAITAYMRWLERNTVETESEDIPT